MKTCDFCHVQVADPREFCPLCGERLREDDAYGYALPGNHYPDLSRLSGQYSFIHRLLLFLSLLGMGTSVLVNVLVPTGVWWCLVVVAAVLYLWLSLPPLLRGGQNYAKRILFQTFFTCLLLVALDFIIGYQGWSVSYVVPGLLCAGIVGIGTIMIFSRTSWAQYVFYQFTIGLLGFIPLVLYFVGVATSIVMVLITAVLGLGSVLVTVVFADSSLKSDFRRRFHH